ncbi:MAG: preprotein translocase subunit SecG [Candidatus Coproplasma sp.]
MLNLLAALNSPQWVAYITLTSIAIALMFIAALAAIVLVLLQQSNSEGIDGITGSSETFFGKNKGQSIESKLKKWTWICLGVLAVIAILFYVASIVLNG